MEVIFKSQMFEVSIFWVFRIFLLENAFFPRACFFFSQTFDFPSKRVGFKVFTIDTAHAKIFAVVEVCHARFEIIAIVFASTSNRFETWKMMFDRRCNFGISSSVTIYSIRMRIFWKSSVGITQIKLEKRSIQHGKVQVLFQIFKVIRSCVKSSDCRTFGKFNKLFSSRVVEVLATPFRKLKNNDANIEFVCKCLCSVKSFKNINLPTLNVKTTIKK